MIHTPESTRREKAMHLALIHTKMLLHDHVLPMLRAEYDSITAGITVLNDAGDLELHVLAREDQQAKEDANSCRSAIEHCDALLDEIAEVGR